ncbi:hypothetical protein [Parachlamydia sp. AcF125]|uniref:hypothetical protein n=1 Tax=Parachlamydia sp. AcF125 TaxID=2795736 RepID=UPI001BCA4044|nr:hypothetical protein [Parachlamydia sp. AcF125]MBS4169220.1 hypothetical protein [Parachlamydia sp. AcF125]
MSGITSKINHLNSSEDFKALLNLKASHFILTKSGHLAKSKFLWRFSDAKTNEEVNRRIKKVVKDCISTIEIWQKENEERPLSDEELINVYSRKEIKRIRQFENNMRKIFEKRLHPFLRQNTDLRLLLANKELQGFLNSRLKELRKNKDSIPEAEKESQKLTRQIEKAKLAAKLGLITAANKGKTGSYFVEWVSMQKGSEGKPAFKKIGVFKLSNKETSWIIRLKNTFKQLFFGQLFYLNTKKLAQSKSEAAAFEISQFLGFQVVPGARVVKLGKKTGTMQRFLDGYQEARKVKYLFNDKANFTEQGWRQFQEMTLCDFLIGNFDRHDDNWLIKVNEEGKIHDIKAIDNAHSFPEKNIWLIKVAARNQYKWRRFPIAEYDYDPKLLSEIRYRLTPLKVEQLISSIDDNLPGFLSEKMIKLLKKRAKVLYFLSDPERKALTPKKLAYYRTASTINALLKGTKTK